MFTIIYEEAFISSPQADMFMNHAHSTLCEEHGVDLDAASVFQPVRQLGEVETLQVEANLQGLAGALHLVGNGHVCHGGGEEERRGLIQSTV